MLRHLLQNCRMRERVMQRLYVGKGQVADKPVGNTLNVSLNNLVSKIAVYS